MTTVAMMMMLMTVMTIERKTETNENKVGANNN